MNFIKPKYYDTLNSSDQKLYQLIQSQLASPTHSNKKNMKISFFKDALESISLFEDHNQEEKWKRCLACGIVFFEGGIGINSAQLSKLFHRCKSSINSSLNEIGYSCIVVKSQGNHDLIKELPILEKLPNELRKWTIRYFNDDSERKETEIQAENQNIDTNSNEEKPDDNEYSDFNLFDIIDFPFDNE